MDQGGVQTQSFIKINDRQFIELYPQREPSQTIGFMHVCFEAFDLEGLNKFYISEGLKPNAVRRAGAGNLLFTMAGPENQNIEYTQYMPGSKHTNDRGKHLGAHRIADEILAVGIAMQDPSSGSDVLQGEAWIYGGKGGTRDKAGSACQELRAAGGDGAASARSGVSVVFFRGSGFAARREATEERWGMKVEKHRRWGSSVLDPDGNRIVFVKANPV
jgi:hypothetical protein